MKTKKIKARSPDSRPARKLSKQAQVFVKNDPVLDRLYKAVVAYVKKHDGSLLVIGGVEVQEWPGNAMGLFRVAVRCMGRKPVFKPAGKPLVKQKGQRK